MSPATASRSLNGSDRRVKEEYRQRVLAAAVRLHYSPNLSAQAVARGRTRSVALVVSDITDPYFSSVAAGVFRAAETAGLMVTIAATERRPDREITLISALRGQKPQVLILVGSRTTDRELNQRLVEELQAFEADGGRVALISPAGLPFDTVTLENETGARLLAIRLAELGYTRFAVLAGPEDLLTAQERLRGITAGLAGMAIDLPDECRIHGAFTRDGGYSAADDFLNRDSDVQIIIAANEVMAVGAMARLREAGRALPGDIAVAGFDDIVTLRDVAPSLTTVRMPLESLGDAAMRMALDLESDGPKIHSVAGSVVVRESTPELRAAARTHFVDGRHL